MADATTPAKSSNTLLYLALAAGAAYFVLGKSSTPAASWLDTTAATDPSGLTPTTTTAPTTTAPTTSASGLLATSGGLLSSVAPAVAAAVAAASAPAVPVDSGGNIYSDGAPHRHAGADVALTSWSDGDRTNIQTIVNYWNSHGGRITVEDAADIVSFQEQQDRKGWNQIASDYANNPSWFQDKVREWNNQGKTPRIQIPT